MKNLFKRAIGKFEDFCKLIKFMFYISDQNIFGQESPKYLLRVIQKFVELEAHKYSSVTFFGRNAIDSAALLESLINAYFRNKSATTLNQIFTVLKDEFIEREENGRKQF